MEEKIKKPKTIKEEKLPITPTEEVTHLEISDVAIADVITEALAKQNITESLLKEMEAMADSLEIEGLTDKDGYAKVDKFRISVKNTRGLAVKLCKSGRAEHIRLQKAWVEKENYYEDRFKAVEEKLAEKQRVIDEEKDKIKLEKERVELARLSDRTAKMVSLGMTYEQETSSYILDEIKLSVVQVKSYDDFTFTTLLAAVETKFKEKEAVYLYKKEQEELAAAEAKVLKEQQLVKEEELKKKEDELTARQKAIEDAEAKAKTDAEARLKAEQDAQIKAEKEKENIAKKVADDLLKSRMSSLFAIGFSQQGNTLSFKEASIEVASLVTISDENFKNNLEVLTTQVAQIKNRIEQERLAEIEKIKLESAENERQKIAAENELKTKLEKEKSEALAKERLRLDALRPDIDRLNAFCKAIMDVPLPAFTSQSYQEFVEVIKNERVNILKNIHKLKPV